MSFASYKNWVNEKFTEDSDPIADLNIGGVVLDNFFYKRKKQLELHMKKLKSRYNDDWRLYLRSILIGKTITAHMEKMAMWNKDLSQKMQNREDGIFTIKVIDIQVEDLDKEWGNNYIIIADDKKLLYKLNINTKIHIS